MQKKQKILNIVTHNGTFHVDDLLAVAAIQLFLKDQPNNIIRTRDPEVIATGDYVVDVGGVCDEATDRFDHHQLGGAGGRKDGIMYSSLGLVWKKYGEPICGSKSIAERIDREMVCPIDMADNGVDVYVPTKEGIHPYLLHRILVKYRPTWKESDVFDERFMELLPFARRLLEREIISARDEEEGVRFVEEAYNNAKDKRIVTLDGAYPWQDLLAQKREPLYVVKPKAHRTAWEVEAVRSNSASFKNRKSLPEEWRGKSSEELAKVTGISDAVFCHNSGYVAVTESKEGALKLAEIAVSSQ